MWTLIMMFFFLSKTVIKNFKLSRKRTLKTEPPVTATPVSFSLSIVDIWGLIVLCRGLFTRCRLFSSTSDLYPVAACSSSQYLHALPGVPTGTKLLLVESHQIPSSTSFPLLDYYGTNLRNYLIWEKIVRMSKCCWWKTFREVSPWGWTWCSQLCWVRYWASGIATPSSVFAGCPAQDVGSVLIGKAFIGGYDPLERTGFWGACE